MAEMQESNNLQKTREENQSVDRRNSSTNWTPEPREGHPTEIKIDRNHQVEGSNINIRADKNTKGHSWFNFANLVDQAAQAAR